MKRKLLWVILTVYLLSAPLSGGALASDSALPFSDVDEEDWFCQAVAYVQAHGLMAGTDAGAFSPEEITSRGMLVTVLHRLEDCPVTPEADFTDVPSGQWYTAGASWAAANGIVSGYGDGRFGPEDGVTREQLAAILYRYCQLKAYATAAPADVSAFPDASQISAYALEPVGWAAANGILSGREDGSLSPQGGATRAETAAVLTRFHQDVIPPAASSPALPPESEAPLPAEEAPSAPAPEKPAYAEPVLPFEPVLPSVPTPTEPEPVPPPVPTPAEPEPVPPPAPAPAEPEPVPPAGPDKKPAEEEPAPIPLESVRILRNGQALEPGGAVRPGDTLTAVAVPSGAAYDLVWTTREKRTEGPSYTVDAQDLGGAVLLSAAGRDGYAGTADARAAVTGELEDSFPLTEPETVSAPVDRGLGRVSVCLTGEGEEAAAAALSAGLPPAPEGDGFQLLLSARFDEAASAGALGTLQIALTPFQGESFGGKSDVYCFDMLTGEEMPPVQIDESENGGFLLTWPKPETGNISIVLGLDGREQMLEIFFDLPEEAGAWYETGSWGTALEALAEGKDVRYTGEEAAALSTSLRLSENQRLKIDAATLTVGKDASLAIPDSARVYLDRLVVERGGRVEADGSLSIQHGGQAAGETLLSGTLQVGAAGSVDILGNLTLTGSGRAALSGPSSGLSVTGTFLNYGALSAGPGSLVLLNGHSENHGLLSAEGATVSLSDKRRALLNTGEITVELRPDPLSDPEYLEDVGSLNILGTSLLNFGKISGTGTLSTGKLDDLSGYKSGLVQPKPEAGTSAASHFAHDPAETVDVLYFPGGLIIADEGVCELKEAEA